MTAATTATAATTTATPVAAASATTSTAATAARRGIHWIVDYEADLTAQILDVIYGGFFQERYAVRVHQELDAFHVQYRVVGLALFFHGQHILKPATLGWHSNHSEGAFLLALFGQNFP